MLILFGFCLVYCFYFLCYNCIVMLNHKYKTKLLNIDLIESELGLSAGQKVADFGCGRSGAFSFLLAKIVGSTGKVYAVDIIKDHLYLVRREADEHNLTNIMTIWADLEKPNSTKLPTESLDAVIIINTLHQAKAPESIIAEAIRVLKKSGALLIIDWSRSASPVGPDEKIDARSLKEAMNSFGLHKIKEFIAGPNHFGLIYSK